MAHFSLFLKKKFSLSSGFETCAKESGQQETLSTNSLSEGSLQPPRPRCSIQGWGNDVCACVDKFCPLCGYSMWGDQAPHYTSQECRALQKTHHNKRGPAKTLSCCNSWHFDEIGQGESKSKVRSCQVLGNSWDSEHEAESCLTPRTPERQEQSVDVDGSCGQPNHPLHLLYIHRQHHHLERWGYTRDEVLRCLS